MRTIALTLGWDGTDYKGWQVQPGMPTIQAEVMRAIESVTGERVTLEPSGRTDTGVHAIAQVVSFVAETAIPGDNLVKALNTQLPRAIRAYAAEDKPAGFHARFDARAKTYRYRIYRDPVCPPERWRYVHHIPYSLDVAEMRAAAAAFQGTHDFTSFTTLAELPAGSRERLIHTSRFDEADSELVYTIRGSGFMHHMVRNIVGTLVEVGKGNWHSSDMQRIIDARDRTTAGPSLPSKGLWLVGVEY